MAYNGYINKEVQKMYGIPYHKLTAEQKKILHADSVRRAKLIDERQQAVLKNNLKAFEDEAKMEKVLASIYKDTQNQILADVAETMAKVKKAGGTWSYANQSALTRSKGLFEQITAELNKLGQKEQIVFTQGLGNIYTDQFLRQVYELGQTIPVKANFNRLNPALIKKTLDYPWSGAMFSDRIWQEKEILGRNIRVGLTQSMILGEGIPEITERINKGIGTANYNAERLARTEVKRVTYCAHNDAYEDMGVEELEYHTAGERSRSGVCDTCNADRGKVYKRGTEPTLPRHPNCKCVYIPKVSDTFGDNELNELTQSVRGAENYEKWRKAEEAKLKQKEILSPAEKKYHSFMDEVDNRYRAKESEITALQAGYDDLDKQYSNLASVRRGLSTPQEAGFKTKAEFEALDRKIATERQKAYDKLEEARKDLKDISREKTYLQTVGAERAGTVEDYRVIRKALKNNSTFDYDRYSDELVSTVSRMDDNALIINKKLSAITENNWYNSNDGSDGAHYSPWKKRVNMRMEENSHERALGNGLLGSWQTKYHEEGHQLDHIIGALKDSNPFWEDGDLTFGAIGHAFTSVSTKTGKAISNAIGTDILDFLNTAISYSNANEGTSYKPIKDLTRITADSRYAFARYINHLNSNGADAKVTCQLGIISDAIGLHTGDRISPHSYGLWGHRSSYNKDRGKNGATSETWATFCALRMCGDTEEVEMAKKIMPNTWSVLDDAFTTLAKWLITNDLTY